MAIFDKIIQLLLHSKVAKAELYLIGGYHNEWLELTYYIETLRNTSNEKAFIANQVSFRNFFTERKHMEVLKRNQFAIKKIKLTGNLFKSLVKPNKIEEKLEIERVA